MVNANANMIGVKHGESASAIASTFANRVVADGGVVESQDCLIDRIQNLKTLGLWDKASAVWMPHGYSEDKLYAVKGGAGADLGFTRNGTRTRKGPTYVEEVPYNLLDNSETFSGWDLGLNATVADNVIFAPNGTLTADKIQATSTSNPNHRIWQSGTFKTGAQVTYRVRLKAGEYTWGVLAFNDNSVLSYANFNLINGSVGITDGVTASIEPDPNGNGWFICTVKRTTVSLSNPQIGPLPSDILIANSWAGDASGTWGIYAWGAQLVYGSEVHDYFKTTDRFNVPALDYTNSTCPSLSLDPSRTNLFVNSERFIGAGWVSNDETITSNAIVGPRGLGNGSLITDGVSGSAGLQQSPGLSSGQVYTISIFAKRGNADWFFISFFQSGANLIRGWYNLSTGTVGSIQNAGTGSGAIAKIKDYGDGWYRCILTGSVSSSGLTVSFNTSDGDLSNTRVNNATKYAFGAQVEPGSYVSSYIPTSGATLTRFADSLNVLTGATSLIGQNEGAVFLDFMAPGMDASFNFPMAIGDATTGNSMTFFVNDAGTFSVSVVIGGSAFAVISELNIFGTRIKALVRYSAASRTGFYNGVKKSSQNTTVTIPAMDRIALGKRNTNLNPFEGAIYTALLIKGPISDAEAIALTTP